MRINVSTYIPRTSPIHACDARVKLVLLLAYSVTLFLVDTWAGLAIAVALFVLAAVLSRIPLRRFFVPIVPVYVLVVFAIVFNGFALNVTQAATLAPPPLWGQELEPFAGLEPMALVGSFGLVPAGLARGCFFVVRVVLLVVTSLVVTYTTTATALTDALASFLRPLRRLRVPVDDIAMMFSLALRFIPLMAEEFGRVYDAQLARGAAFGEGGLRERLSSWQTVLIPLFVGLFRRSDALAVAMDARCYGAEQLRSSLYDRHFTGASLVVLVGGLALCATMCVTL